MKPIRTCADELRTRAADDGHWRLTIGELSDLTGIAETEIYSTAYRLGDRVNFSDAVDGFTDETVGDLVTVLEDLYEGEVESAFTEAGVFIPHDRRLDLMANFLALVQNEAGDHAVDQDTFLAMMLHFRSFEESFHTYVREFFDLDGAMDRAAEFYRRTNELPAAAFHSARNYLGLLFVRKILQIRGLFVTLRNQLAEIAWSHGLLGSGRQRYYTYGHAEDDEQAAPERSDAVGDALKVMQLSKHELSVDRLREQYKRLMKRYHPDVNPEGLEMSKRITSSYALLLQAM